jgi:hypothetical protein
MTIPPWLWWLLVVWTLAVAILYLLVLLLLHAHSQLSPETAFSAAQVALGLLGVVAIFAALMSLAKQLERPEARLDIEVLDLGESQTLLLLSNHGTAPAHNVMLSLVGGDVANLGPLWRDAGRTADGIVCRYLFDGVLVPGVESVALSSRPLLVTACATGVGEAVWHV